MENTQAHSGSDLDLQTRKLAADAETAHVEAVVSGIGKHVHSNPAGRVVPGPKAAQTCADAKLRTDV